MDERGSFTVGDILCAIASDGISLYEPEDVFANAPREEWHPLIADRLDPEGLLPLPYQPVLIRTPEATLLVDAGAGTVLAEEWEEPIGRLRDSLRDLGVARADVDVVVLTHAHPDHVGGLTEKRDAELFPVFAGARHVICDVELDYWTSDDLSGVSARMAESVVPHLRTLENAGLLEGVEAGAEIVDGIRTFATPGHTPGHMSISVSSAGATGIVAGDAVLTEWSFAHPDWYAAAEVNAEQAVATRRSVLARAAEERSTITAYHVSGLGRVRAVQGGFALDGDP